MSMGILGNIVNRDIRGDARKEDSSLLYFNLEGTMTLTVETGEYGGMKWEIGTCGEHPYINIHHQTTPSAFDGIDFVHLPDRNGKKLKINRLCIMHPVINGTWNGGISGTWTGGQRETIFIYSYINREDYTFSGCCGHKYTVRELKDDIKSIIDSIIKEEDKYIKSK